MSQLFAGSNSNIINITKGSSQIQGLYKGSELLWPSLNPFTWGSQTSSNIALDGYVYVPELSSYIGYIASGNTLYISTNATTWSVWYTLISEQGLIDGIGYNKYSTSNFKLILSRHYGTNYYCSLMNISNNGILDIIGPYTSTNRPILLDDNKFKLYGSYIPYYINSSDVATQITSPDYTIDSTNYNYDVFSTCTSINESTLALIVEETLKVSPNTVTTRFYYGSSYTIINSIPYGESGYYYMSTGFGKPIAFSNNINTPTIHRYNGVTHKSGTQTGLPNRLSVIPAWTGENGIYITAFLGSYSGVYSSIDGINWNSISNLSAVTGNIVKYFSNNTAHVINTVNDSVTIGYIA